MERIPLTRRERGQLWTRLGIRVLLSAAVVMLAVLAGRWLLSLLMPFVLALPVAWLLNPLVRRLQRKLSVSRKVISLVLLLILFCLVGGVLYGVGRLAVSQVRSLLDNWQPMMEELLAAVDRITAWLNRVLPEHMAITSGEIARELTQWIQSIDLSGWVASAAERAPSLLSRLSGFGVAAVVFVMASYFITGDYPRLRFLLADRVSSDVRAFCATVKDIFMKAFGGYLKSQLLLSLGVFLILSGGFLLVRQPYSLLLAAGLAVLDFIPLVGAGTIMVPWAAVELMGGRWQAAVSLLVIWGLIVLFRRVAEPKILGNETGLSPILSLTGIYVGMRLGGVAGMVLGPLLLLVLLNLGRQGVFRPAVDDLRLASRDVLGMLKNGRSH